MRKIFQLALIMGLCAPRAFADDSSNAYRARVRAWVMSHAKRALPTIAPAGNDQASDFVDELRYTNLARMEEAKLLSATLEVGPWSGSYWPTYAGSIANRYGDPKFMESMNWKENAKYLGSVIGRGTNKDLSPAEKYDMLIGDTSFTLTKNMIQSGAPYAERDGTVPTWFGICHGWAPASFMESRPQHSVKTKAPNGKEIVFTPSDMKALASLLWANGAGETRYIGGRCNDENPARDGNHRATNPDCFDTNPATWHISVVNQIGVSKRGFVADVSPGSEVWNQPAVGYKYTYSNPVTNAAAATLAEAKVRLADWHEDPYTHTRATDAVFVVKVTMSFEYGAETSASVATEDRPEMDAHATQNYIYDLELDANDNIVGGEWYSTAHPDFLWVPAPGAAASSTGDALLSRDGDTAHWDAASAIPGSWKAAAKISSSGDQPLARVVKRLLEFSQQ